MRIDINHPSRLIKNKEGYQPMNPPKGPPPPPPPPPVKKKKKGLTDNQSIALSQALRRHLRGQEHIERDGPEINVTLEISVTETDFGVAYRRLYDAFKAAVEAVEAAEEPS